MGCLLYTSIGYCNGKNHKADTMEYHRGEELEDVYKRQAVGWLKKHGPELWIR